MKKNAFLSFSLVAGILLALFFVNGFAPFGPESLAGNDARIQYIDFLLYLKDVLAGENSITYTFSKLLGGTSIALFSYYLASPLNLLVIFFPDTEILSFIDLLILLKAALASASFSIFLSVRFSKAAETSEKRFFSVFLSAGYGLSQYVLAQCSNIMWLDGVILLPLVLLGVYEVVNGKALWHLAVPVALSVLLNWYTAGMNCLFTAVWFILEFALKAVDPNSDSKQINFFRAMGRWIAGMLLGLLCSAFLFVPTVYAMLGNEKGDLNFWLLLIPKLRCYPHVLIESTIYGARSTEKSLSLFCGILPLLGTTSLFLKKERPARKIIFAFFLLFLALMFCWTPLFSLYNLLELPTSYFCRYSYLQVFGLLFIASWSFLNNEEQSTKYWLSAILYTAILLLVYLFRPYEKPVSVYLTAVAILLVSFFLDLYQKSSYREGSPKKLAGFLLALLLIADLVFSSQLQLTFTDRYTNAGPETPAYITGQQQLINALREYDSETYRITQTRNRWTDEGRWTANYDESFAYNYRSISEYSSTAPAIQLRFLEQAGYRTEADVISIINTSILGTDSLLGVRYILTDVPINGTIKVSDIPGFDGKEVYLNPYALPMAFRYQPSSAAMILKPAETDNSFEYQNRLYSALLGEEVELYTPLKYETKKLAADNSINQYIYTLTLPEGNYAVYGNIPSENSLGLPKLDLNGMDTSVYACWLAPSVFYIPTGAGETEAKVELSGKVIVEEGAEQFYALDLDLLEQITDAIKAHPVTEGNIQNGTITVHTKANTGDCLFLSVPRDRGWRIRLNGELVEPVYFAELFYSFPLREGENTLTMHYNIPYLTEGIVLSVIGLALLLGSTLIPKKRRT